MKMKDKSISDKFAAKQKAFDEFMENKGKDILKTHDIGKLDMPQKTKDDVYNRVFDVNNEYARAIWNMAIDECVKIYSENWQWHPEYIQRRMGELKK